MKLLHITDIHLGYPPVDPVVSYHNLSRTVLPLIDDSISAVVITGDYLHSLLHLENRATKIAYHFMDKVKELCRPHAIPILLLMGTSEHDRRQLSNFIDDYDHIHYFDSMDIVKIPNIGYVGTIPDDLPYPDAQKVFIKRVSDETPNNTVDLLLLHGFLREEIPPNVPIDPYNVFDIPTLAKVTPLILKGHVHTPRVYRKPITVVNGGSFELMRHGEEGRRGIHVITKTGNDIKVQFVENIGTYVYTSIVIEDTETDPYQYVKGRVEDIVRSCNEHTPEPLNIRLVCSTLIRDKLPLDSLVVSKRIKYTFKSTNKQNLTVTDTTLKPLDLPPITEDTVPEALALYLNNQLSPTRIREILKEISND